MIMAASRATVEVVEAVTSIKSELLVRELLESAGFTVSPIPRSRNRRTADFLVADDDHRYLVEVTEKPPKHDYQEFAKRANADGAAILKRLMDRDKRIDDTLHDKTDQLRQTLISTDFNVLAVTAIHEDAEYLLEVLRRTLYGIADLQAIRTMTIEAITQAISDGTMERVCFYYDHPSLMDHTDLHGVMFAGVDKVCLFVNPFASKVAAFRPSRLCSEFAAKKSLIDPEVQEGSIWFLDGEVDRTDEKAKHAALHKKYGMLTQRTRDASWKGMMVQSLIK
jgi:hypothetical protein